MKLFVYGPFVIAYIYLVLFMVRTQVWVDNQAQSCTSCRLQLERSMRKFPDICALKPDAFGTFLWNSTPLQDPLADIGSYLHGLYPLEWEAVVGHMVLTVWKSDRELREKPGTANMSIQSSLNTQVHNYTSNLQKLHKSMRFPQRFVLHIDEPDTLNLKDLQNGFCYVDKGSQAYQKILDISEQNNSLGHVLDARTSPSLRDQLRQLIQSENSMEVIGHVRDQQEEFQDNTDTPREMNGQSESQFYTRLHTHHMRQLTLTEGSLEVNRHNRDHQEEFQDNTDIAREMNGQNESQFCTRLHTDDMRQLTLTEGSLEVNRHKRDHQEEFQDNTDIARENNGQNEPLSRTGLHTDHMRQLTLTEGSLEVNGYETNQQEEVQDNTDTAGEINGQNEPQSQSGLHADHTIYMRHSTLTEGSLEVNGYETDQTENEQQMNMAGQMDVQNKPQSQIRNYTDQLRQLASTEDSLEWDACEGNHDEDQEIFYDNRGTCGDHHGKTFTDDVYPQQEQM